MKIIINNDNLFDYNKSHSLIAAFNISKNEELTDCLISYYSE